MPVLLNHEQRTSNAGGTLPFRQQAQSRRARFAVVLECHRSLPQKLTSPNSWHHGSLPLTDAYAESCQAGHCTFPRTGCCNLPAVLCTSCQELIGTRQAAGPSGNSCKMPHPMQTSFGPVAPVLLTAINQVTLALPLLQDDEQRIICWAAWRQRDS